MLKKVLAWLAVGSVLLVSFGVWITWRHLNERLHSSEFREGLERGLSNALEGKMVLNDLQGHVGFHPWVGVKNISFAGENGDFRGTAKEIRVAMEVLPLLQRKVVFSQITFLSPRLRLRRRPDGSPPVLPRPKKTERNQAGLEFRIDHLLIENATIDLVDESRAEHPSFQVMADVSIHRKTNGEGLDLKASGTFPKNVKKGKFTLEGQVGGGTNLRLIVSGLPLNTATTFYPDLAPWEGSVGLTGTYAGEDKDRHWKINGQLIDLHHAPTDTPLPLQVNWNVRSDSPSVVRAVWVSTTSDVVAELRLDDFQRRRLTVQVNGKNLDLMEFSPFLSLLPTPSTGSVQRAPLWNMKAKVDLENIVWKQWNAHHLKIVADGNRSQGRLSELSCNVFQSTVNVLGTWGPTTTAKDVLALTGTMESSSVTVKGEYQTSLHPKPLRDFLFDKTSQWGFDVRVSSAHWKGVPLTDVSGRFSLGPDGVVRAENVGGSAAGGTGLLNGEIGGLPENGPLTFALNGRMNDVETKDLVAAISTSAYLINGRFSGSIDLSGPLRPWNVNGLNGNVSFKGLRGEFRTAPKVLEIFSALKINSMLRRLGGEKETGLPFDVFEASGPIRAGRYVMDQPLLLKNASFQMAYTGWMHVRFESGKGTLLFNFLESTSHLVKAIPVVGSLILGSHGELLPLVVDVAVENGKVDVKPRSIKTLTGPLVSVVKNVFRLPFHIFSPKKTNSE
jgi:uncharacterized protein involved in outer membrane biogenesis